jgi:FAD/FMN-containing dehydrogenase
MSDTGILQKITEAMSPAEIGDIAGFGPMNPVRAAGIVAPSAIAKPKDDKSLQKLVKLAITEKLSLVPVSSSAPHLGGGAASSSEWIAVDLSGWKRIDLIDRRNRVCRIQPGVTFGELERALTSYGMSLPAPLCPRQGKSALAAVMDREPTTWPNRQWDIADPVASTELLFGTGDFFRTGAGAGPGTIEQQLAAGGALKNPLGPSQTDFHRVVQGSQGTMGIVTWITVRLELKPTEQEPYLLSAANLDALIPFVYEVQRPWLGEQSFILNSTAAAMLMGGTPGDSGGFICFQNIAGFERLPKERVAYQREDIRAIAAKNKLELVAKAGSVGADELLNRLSSPGTEPGWRNSASGTSLRIFFMSTLDKSPAFCKQILSLAEKKGIGAGRIGIYIQPMVQNHSCHIEFIVPFSSAEQESVRKLEEEAVPELMNAGAFFSRPYGKAQEAVFSKNRLNYEMVKKVKDIFDPDRVLNRGKWGL